MAKINIDIKKNEDNEDVVKVWGLLNKNIVNSEQKLYISTYLIENGIGTENFPQLGLDDEDAPADLAEKFRHNGVIRSNICTVSTGDMLSVSKGEQYTFEVTYDPLVYKTAWNKDNMQIVSFIHLNNKTNIAKNYVLNAAVHDGLTSDIKEISNSTQKENNTTYDITGKKVGKDFMGIIIKNGKKYFVK